MMSRGNGRPIMRVRKKGWVNGGYEKKVMEGAMYEMGVREKERDAGNDDRRGERSRGRTLRRVYLGEMATIGMAALW